MKTSIKLLFLSVVLCFMMNNTISAQTDPTNPTYLSVTYMKVKPGMQADYLAMEKAWKKIHKAKLGAGMIQGWSLFQVMYPGGSAKEYDYVTYANLGKNADAAKSLDGDFFPENWQKLLTKEELALVNRTGEFRTVVKEEIWQLRDGIYDENWMDAKIQVCNFFAVAKGKTGKDQYDVEKKYWVPVHQARIDNDELEGWDISNLYLPFGSNEEYEVSTTDIYKNMTQYMKTIDMETYMKKAHPNKTMSQITSEGRAISTLMKGEVRQLLDRVN